MSAHSDSVESTSRRWLHRPLWAFQSCCGRASACAYFERQHYFRSLLLFYLSNCLGCYICFCCSCCFLPFLFRMLLSILFYMVVFFVCSVDICRCSYMPRNVLSASPPRRLRLRLRASSDRQHEQIFIQCFSVQSFAPQ